MDCLNVVETDGRCSPSEGRVSPGLSDHPRKHSNSDLQSRLKARKLLGVGELVGNNGDIYRSKVSLFVEFPIAIHRTHLSGTWALKETLRTPLLAARTVWSRRVASRASLEHRGLTSKRSNSLSDAEKNGERLTANNGDASAFNGDY
uniref:Tumor protein p53-inducible protein 11 n=1 Tax=Plectus sambesii TaxID=2011161 RepID=A0A914W377_9BILA